MGADARGRRIPPPTPPIARHSTVTLPSIARRAPCRRGVPRRRDRSRPAPSGERRAVTGGSTRLGGFGWPLTRRVGWPRMASRDPSRTLLRRLAPTLAARPRRHLPEPRLVRGLPPRGAGRAGASPRPPGGGAGAVHGAGAGGAARPGARRARRVRGRRSGRPRLRPERHDGRQHGAPVAGSRGGRRAPRHGPHLQRLPERAGGRGGSRGRARRRGHPAVPRRHAGAGARSGAVAGEPADAAGARRPRDEPDGPGPSDRAARPRARVARGRRAGRRRARPRDGPARPPSARRRLLHGELPQVDLRAEGLGVPARQARPPEGRAPAGDQPRRQLAADGPLDVPARVRLDGHRRPHGLPHRPGGHPLHGVAPARRLAGAHGAQPGHRPRGPRPPVRRAGRAASGAGLDDRVPRRAARAAGLRPGPGGRRARPAPDRPLRPLRTRAPGLHLAGARVPDPPRLRPALQRGRGLRAPGRGAGGAPGEPDERRGRTAPEPRRTRRP